ncbi:hypothetical protein EOC94_04415 [Mesorhizobium sp. M6A.T.Ce.TU.016.01.1.1]|nr:hypothetical protein EOC94_04415 [Mesorhizobium sp. M6A.T.Ce.TU.016.01.1.1]
MCRTWPPRRRRCWRRASLIGARSSAATSFVRSRVGGDLYILKRILVDQTDDTAMAVLRNVRTAIAPQGALLIADPGVESLYGRSFDMLMLMIFGGKLRSESDLAALLEKAGFRLTRTMKTASAIHLVEAVPI